MLFLLWYVSNRLEKISTGVDILPWVDVEADAGTLPFVLLLMDYWPLNRMAINTRNKTELQPSLKSGKPN
jgi:hypothetical protein